MWPSHTRVCGTQSLILLGRQQCFSQGPGSFGYVVPQALRSQNLWKLACEQGKRQWRRPTSETHHCLDAKGVGMEPLAGKLSPNSSSEDGEA